MERWRSGRWWAAIVSSYFPVIGVPVFLLFGELKELAKPFETIVRDDESASRPTVSSQHDLQLPLFVDGPNLVR